MFKLVVWFMIEEKL